MTSHHHRLALAGLIALAACSSSSATSSGNELFDGNADPSARVGDEGGPPTTSDEAGVDRPVDPSACGASCPTGSTCRTANKLPVCRNDKTGIPLFTHVFLVVMENISLSTVDAANPTATPHIKAIEARAASSSAYHGVAHPSLPNYIAMTSGDTQGIACDCMAAPGTACTASCNTLSHACTCTRAVKNVADQIEDAKKTWKAYGEGMGTACNVNDDSNTNYAVRHVPFLYYEGIQKSAQRCKDHVVDLAGFDVSNAAPHFSFVAPNLDDDGHDPTNPLSHATNIANADAFIGPFVDKIQAGEAYKKGGLLVVVWDEDDNSGGLTNTDDPIPLFVMSIYAKSKYASMVMADHYSLLATIEDGLGLPRLGKAGQARPGVADTLSDLFPSE
jgi:hypothetical protein